MADFSAVRLVGGQTDFVISPDGATVYIATSTGKVHRWDVATQTYLDPITLGGSLSTIDISPDGSYLLVGRSNMVDESGGQHDYVGHTIIDRVSTSTLAVTSFDLRVTGYERGIANVAVVGENTALTTSSFSGSGWTPFRTFDPTDAVFSPATVDGLPSARHGTFLIPDSDNRYVLVLEADISNGPIHLYDAEAGEIVASTDLYKLGTSGFQVGKGDLNSVAGLALVITYNHIFVFDYDLNLIADLSALQTAGRAVGGQFTADGEHLLLWDSTTDTLVAFDTWNWDAVAAVDLITNVGPNGVNYGDMDVSRDGRFVVLDTEDGFELIDLAARLSIDIEGAEDDDQLYGSVGADFLYGAGGDDFLSGGDGPDLLDGGVGADTAMYLSARRSVSVNVGLTAAQDTGGGGIDTLVSIENVYGSPYDDVLIGDAGANVLYGYRGVDRLYGGSGDDSYYVDGQDDLVFEAPDGGRDRVGAYASIYLYENVEELHMMAGAGAGYGVGNALDNVILGNASANLLLGGAGNDRLWGYEGDDRMFGETGDDRLDGGDGADFLVGGAGDDVLLGRGGDDALYGEDGADVLEGGDGRDVMVGGAGADILNGAGGGGEQDLMDGGAGDDVYYVDSADDLTFETADGGTDTVYARIPGGGYYLYPHVENLTLILETAYGVGNDLANVMTGSDGDNWLLGGAGNDTLNGKTGNDVLFGQAGADTFVFERGTGGDVIGDFAVGVDKVQLTGLGYSWQDIQNSFHQNGADTALDLGQGDFVVFQKVAISAFSEGDFVF